MADARKLQYKLEVAVVQVRLDAGGDGILLVLVGKHFAHVGEQAGDGVAAAWARVSVSAVPPAAPQATRSLSVMRVRTAGLAMSNISEQMSCALIGSMAAARGCRCTP